MSDLRNQQIKLNSLLFLNEENIKLTKGLFHNE
jgi:hypothetical protein